ncbi:hypothetical protein VOLCADRAFT_86041 [Volvox carteri f. nagariensis]|uniref:Uncharacterized protein n=1 Tax=Volvox carteri f. nagariensis TaxID=3068 RepID=D8THP6_VOLCA|nr:uncharacterized protein VOLCADRAFT_86041 [Volvox carteri f. nagariensis]EFJ52750.1 hypothetical protein VOLCADRAFT_86041 [Volvox carteri f. nagariensis]|eukprot:XP_002945755.1 hypothetical protein VOLCADRAFT_86041 [Volvox carteri f. nagariensis]
MRALSLVPHAKASNQKNEGVYFEYEPVDPDAAEEIAGLEGEDEEQFSWAQRSRDRKKAYQDKTRNWISDDSRRQRKSGKRGWRSNDAGDKDRRKATTAAERSAAAVPSDGPVLPSFSPVETPAMRTRALTPEELLIRPTISTSTSKSETAPTPAGTLPSPSTISTSDGVNNQISNVGEARSSSLNNASSSSSHASGSSPAPVTDTSAPQAAVGGPAAAAAGSDRRQRLLQRMKGAAAGDGGGASSPAPVPRSAEAGLQGRDAGTGDEKVVAGGSSYSDVDVAGGAIGASNAAAAATAAAAAAAASSTASVAMGADLRAQLTALADQLPPESELPADAQRARSLLASILNPSGEDVREVTAGDVTEMLQRDLSAQEEFAEWLRRASKRGGGTAAAVAGDEGMADELTEAEAADLMAALANLDLEGDLADLGADLDLGLGDDSDDNDGGGGDAAVGAAMREVSELRQLMQQLDQDGGGPEEGNDGGAATAARDMTDEQVLETLKTSDPALYELLKDVPEFDKLDLDLDLDLDLESAAEKLTEEDLAEAQAAGAGDEEEDLEELLRDMRGLGLMRKAGDGGEDEDDEVVEDDDDDDDGDLALGDLLEGIDEDEELDSSTRMRAQFALQSMFNQPADELTAKGTRSGGGGGDGQVPPLPTQRSTTGMARGAVAVDDEDGGAAPPPALPRPKPKPRSA